LIIDGSTAASSVIALPLALAYVVLRQDLLGVDTRIRVTTERALGVLGVALVAVIVLSVSAVLFQLPVPIIAFIALPTIMIGILAPTIFYGMRTFTEAWIFPEMGRYRRLIRNARTGGLLDEHETAEALIGEITFALPVHHTTLLVRHDEVGLFEVVGGLEIPPVTVDHPILAAFTNRSMAVVREDLAAYQPLPFQAPPGAHWECFVPIALENRLVGLLLLGPRDDDIGYSTTDRTQLFRLANQRAVALDYLRVLSALRASLEEQKRIDALKDQFIMTAHHELRTPLTSMMGYIDIVARMGSDAWQKEPEDVELMVGEALRSGEDLVHLLDTLLAADRASVRSPDLHPAYIALGEMLRRLATDVEMAGPGQADRISVACPPELVAYADREAFGQVIINLLSNAVKYSPAGAPIEIAAWRRADAPLVEIAVRDYGDGVPPDQQSAIFEKFIRLERDLNSPIRGTGLGLAIVRDRVQAMGGKVWVESTGIPGEGATFHVTLPASPAEAMAAATDPALPVAVTASPTAPAATPKAEAVDELTDTLPRHKLVRYGPPLDER
jgi:signal transduction histidine kinase